MAIRKQIEWIGKNVTGYIDIGTGLKSDIISEAREVAINDSWKITVGYFLIDGLDSAEKAKFVRKCLEFVTLLWQKNWGVIFLMQLN